MPTPDAPAVDWAESLGAARSGCPDALGALLERCRPALLRMAARAQDRGLQSKAGGSDIVQDSLLEGHQGFGSFRGEQPEELLAWLRQILAHNVANFRRRYRDAEMRDVRRERPLPWEAASAAAGDRLASASGCPAAAAMRREEDARLDAAVEALPAAVRLVVLWRQRDTLSFEQIGLKLGRTPEGARQVWWQAVRELRVKLAEPAESA